MRMLLSVLPAVVFLTCSAVHAKNLSVDLDMKKPEVSAKQAEADEWLNTGNAAYQAKNYDEAIACYKKATELDPSFASAFYNLGIMYTAKGLPDESIAAYKQVLAIKPDYHAARNNLATLYIDKGMIDAAISELNQALEVNPDLPHAHFNLGECYFAKGNKTQAADHYYKAGTLFVAQKDKVWMQKSCDGLKKTNAEALEKSLIEKINEGLKQEKDLMQAPPPGARDQK